MISSYLIPITSPKKHIYYNEISTKKYLFVVPETKVEETE